LDRSHKDRLIREARAIKRKSNGVSAGCAGFSWRPPPEALVCLGVPCVPEARIASSHGREPVVAEAREMQ